MQKFCYETLPQLQAPVNKKLPILQLGLLGWSGSHCLQVTFVLQMLNCLNTSKEVSIFNTEKTRCTYEEQNTRLDVT